MAQSDVAAETFAPQADASLAKENDPIAAVDGKDGVPTMSVESTSDGVDAGAPQEAAVTEAPRAVDPPGSTKADEDVAPFPPYTYHADMSYIKNRTADPANVRKPSLVNSWSADMPASASVKKEDGKWSVDMSYIDNRTNDPNRLEARRGMEQQKVDTISATVKKEGESWSVDMSHIDTRTKDPDRLKARRSIGPAQANDGTSHSATVKKTEDGKWSVDTSYIDARTKDPNCLQARRGQAVGGVPEVAPAASTKTDDGKWRQVATPHIGIRTADVDNIAARRRAIGGDAEVSATVKKDGAGWKVDTSYIGHRTADCENIRQVESSKQIVYADPAETKYPYEQLKLPVGERPNDVDPGTKELYLSEEEFQTVFAMAFAEFTKMPKWKQVNLKKAKQLY